MNVGSRSITVEGLSIAFRESGEGPAVVLLHGFLCDHRCWMRQLSGLADEFRIVAWDAPGAGSSSDPPGPFTTADWAHCLARFLDALDIQRACVVGLSWGGILAQELYHAHPGRVEALVLADTYAGWRGSLPPEVVERRLERCFRDSGLSGRELAAGWVAEMFTDAAPRELLEEMGAIVSDFHPLGFRLMARSSADADTTDFLSTIHVPTLVLWGDGDRRSPVEIGRELRRSIPRSELVVLAGAGHLSNMERPEEFNAQVRRFCRSVLERDAAR